MLNLLTKGSNKNVEGEGEGYGV